MNEKFFYLTKEKQNAIIDAGYRVFSENKYKKSPMSEIAAEAGISKSLLFHYFKNKKEFYLYLYDYGANLVLEVAKNEFVFTNPDFFELYLQGAKCKLGVFRKHPYIFSFMVNAYYEEDQEVAADISERNISFLQYRDNNFLQYSDLSRFKEGTDIKQLSNIIMWAAEGYMKEKSQQQPLNIDDLEVGFKEMLDFFKKISYKEEYL